LSALSAIRRSASPASLTRDLPDQLLDPEEQVALVEPRVDLVVDLLGRPVVPKGVSRVRHGSERLAGRFQAGDHMTVEDVLQAEEVVFAGDLFLAAGFVSSSSIVSVKPAFSQCSWVLRFSSS
jgi:hypothetical protein